MKCLLSVSLATLIVAANFALSGPAQTPELRRGIGVQMAVTSNAAPMPEADNADAWIVAVTRDGSVFFGTDKVTPESLADVMKSRPRNRQAKLYIKADARAPFADVRRVFTAAHDMAFDAAVLLTSQTEPAAAGVVPPKGLEVQIAPHSNQARVVVQVNAGQPSPTFQVNDQETSEAALPDALKRILQDRSDSPVLVKTHGPVSFGQVVHVIDACRSIGAKVMLSTPQL